MNKLNELLESFGEVILIIFIIPIILPLLTAKIERLENENEELKEFISWSYKDKSDY